MKPSLSKDVIWRDVYLQRDDKDRLSTTIPKQHRVASKPSYTSKDPLAGAQDLRQIGKGWNSNMKPSFRKLQKVASWQHATLLGIGSNYP